MLKYFKAITSAEYKQGVTEYEEFIRDNTVPMFFFEDWVEGWHYSDVEDISAIFVQNETNLYDYILTEQEIKAIKDIFEEFNSNQIKLRSPGNLSYADYCNLSYADYLGVIETSKMNFPEDDKLPRLILANINISNSKQITYEAAACEDQNETLYFHLYLPYRELKTEIYKTSNEWFWIEILYKSEEVSYYRCDGFLGLIKLIKKCILEHE